MKKIWLVSDLHLGHDKEFIWGARGFKSVEEHDAEIIERWNKVVNAEDDVYILGDLILGDSEAGIEKLKQLHGNIFIIYGNHDTKARQKLYAELPNNFEICGYATTLKYKKFHFYLSHYPTLTSNNDNDKPLKARVINLCGHTHSDNIYSDMDKGLIYHVDLDANNCYPTLLDDIIINIQDYLTEKEL